MTLLTLSILIIIAVSTHTSSSSGTWFLGVVLFWIPLRVAGAKLLPPSFEVGRFQTKFTVMASVFTCALTVFAIEFVLFGWAHLALGASSQELSEHLARISVPLGWVTSAFIIRPDKSFTDVCGIIFANSFFYGIPMFACYRVVRWAHDRDRTVQIGIAGRVDAEAEEE